MNAGQAGTAQKCFPDCLARFATAMNYRENFRGQARLIKDLQNGMKGKHSVGSRLTDNHIAHHGRSRAEIAGNSHEVVRRQSRYESFKRPPVGEIQTGGLAIRLFSVNLVSVVDVEIPEIDQFADIDHCLIRVLGEILHGCRNQLVEVLCLQKISCFAEDIEPHVPRNPVPFLSRI